MDETFSKKLKITAIAALVLLLLLAAYPAYKYLYYTLPPQLVSITVQYQPGPPCRKDSPLHMKIENNSYREVLGTSFALSVKADKNSDNIVQLLSNAYTTDTIIKAGNAYEGCWSYPKLYTNKHDPEKLIYAMERQTIKFSD